MTTTIKEHRTARGITQEELSVLVGVRRETVVFMEKGKYNPSLRLAYRTAQALRVPIEQLFSFADEDWSPVASRRNAK
jgi:putative transcriptional regulator